MPLELIILSGEAGSGKSTAMQALEDDGFFCVDNLPATLLPLMLEQLSDEERPKRVAVAIDVRQPKMLQQTPQLLEQLRQSTINCRLLYLIAAPEARQRRYSTTRRKHPLDTGDGLTQAMLRETSLLASLKDKADRVIDTTELSPHQLRARVIWELSTTTPGEHLGISLVSFGFKHGILRDADMVFDVRFLPNPYFDPNLKHLTGQDQEIRDYVLSTEAGKGYIENTYRYLQYLIPQFRQEGKSYLTVGIGCTGGQHRSVSIAYALTALLRADGMLINLRHREIDSKRVRTRPEQDKLSL